MKITLFLFIALSVSAQVAPTTPIYPESFGAKRDGVTNDLPAFQAAADAADAAGGGTIQLSRGTYYLNGQWTIGVSNSQHQINVIGLGPLATRINSNTPALGFAIYLSNWDYSTMSGLSLVQVGINGNGIGIDLGGTGSGTNSYGSMFRNIGISNFGICLSSTNNSGATSSEVQFDSISFQHCGTGFLNNNFNGLNFVFHELQMAFNTIGMNMNTSGVTVIGGSASQNQTDFRFTNGGINTVIGFRSEGASLCVKMDGASSLTLIEFLCQYLNGGGDSHTAVYQRNGQLTIDTSQIEGQILIDSIWGISIRNSYILDGNNTYSVTSQPVGMGPGFRIASTNYCAPNGLPGGVACGTFESVNNRQRNAANNIATAIPSGTGIITSRPNPTAIFTAH